MTKTDTRNITAVCETILDYLVGCQDFTAGEYYGSFWSEKGYHGPLGCLGQESEQGHGVGERP